MQVIEPQAYKEQLKKARFRDVRRFGAFSMAYSTLQKSIREDKEISECVKKTRQRNSVDIHLLSQENPQKQEMSL